MTTHRWLFVGLALMAAVGGIGTALVSGQRPLHPTIGLELIDMSNETSSGGFVIRRSIGGEVQSARPQLPSAEELRNIKTAEDLQKEHTARLKEIVDQYGWPGKRLVGYDGAHAAFNLLQQTGDRAFRARALQLMQQLPKGQVDPDDLAITTDRVAVEQGKPQTFGTQLSCNRDTGVIEFMNGIADEANLDKRRADVGLPPIRTDFADARFKFGACEVGDFAPTDELPPPAQR